MLKRIPFEAICWFTALIVLAVSDLEQTHFTLCPLKTLGFDFCPGCGLGKSISLLFHGKLAESLQTHPLGIFSVIVLSFRITNLSRLYIQHYGKSY